MGAFSPGIKVSGLNIDSRQGDKAVIEILQSFHGNINISGNAVISKRGNLTGSEIEAADIPDIVPALSIVAAGAKGVTIIRNVSGLRYKESDRIRAIIDMIHSLGGAAEYRNNHLIITGKGMLHGGVINSYGDHRIAMAGAVASCICKGEVEILDYRCTDKSYPDFWDDFKGLEAVKD